MKFAWGFITGVIVSMLVMLVVLRRQVSPEPSALPQSRTSQTINPEEIPNLPADFEVFYEQFHTDSAFQMAHIEFPLEGIPSAATPEELEDGSFRWLPSFWIPHQAFDDMDGQFVQQFYAMGDGLVVEWIKDSSGRFGMQRRFAKKGDSWSLIYYAGMNQLGKEEVE